MTKQQREQLEAEQAKAASVAKTQQQNKDRGVRRARGGGGPSAECAASPAVLPKAPVQHDDRDGPAELRRHISDATRGADRYMLVCMRCAGPVIVAKARADQNEVERSTQRVYWDELCAMLQVADGQNDAQVRPGF